MPKLPLKEGEEFSERQPPLWGRSSNDTTSTKCVEVLDYPSYYHLLHSLTFLQQFAFSSRISLKVVDKVQILTLSVADWGREWGCL